MCGQEQTKTNIEEEGGQECSKLSEMGKLPSSGNLSMRKMSLFLNHLVTPQPKCISVASVQLSVDELAQLLEVLHSWGQSIGSDALIE